ncbi:zinc finger BED domain-containing protein RICESLEEPER 2-like protein [Tanacetum coccineum]
MASESASTTTGVGSTSALTIREIIPTNRTPEVWKDFNMCIMTNGQKKAQCKYCFHFLSEGSNTTLKNHITHPHCEVLKAQQNQNPEAGQTSMGRDGQIFMYNPDYLREQFAGLVIQRGLPFNHFDHEQTTRVFQNTMQPRYTHVSRSTLKRDAMKLWVAAKQATIDGFANLNMNGPYTSPNGSLVPTCLIRTVMPAPRKKLDSEFNDEENKLEMADTQAEIILSQGLPRHIFNNLNQTSTAKRFLGLRWKCLCTDQFSTKPSNQLRTSSNSRTHATVHDGHIVTEPIQRKAPGNVGNTGTRGKKVICYNCRGEGHVARQCKEPKRKMDSQYFKDKALLMEAKEKGDVLDAEAEAFLADDAYDSDVDEGPNAAIAFMANLSSTSAANSQVNEVHSNDNQIFDNVDYQLNQEMHQGEHLDSDAETEIDDNTIPYHQYLLDTEAQNVPTENANKVARDILQRFNMPTETIPMLFKKPKKATADLHKDLLGTRNPGLGYMAKRAQPALYVCYPFAFLLTNPLVLWDSEEECPSREQAYWLPANERVCQLVTQIVTLSLLLFIKVDLQVKFWPVFVMLMLLFFNLKKTVFSNKHIAESSSLSEVKTSVGPFTPQETPKVLAPGMYNLGSKYIPPPKRANWVKPSPLPKKKQVTFQEPHRTSTRPTQKPPVQQKQEHNVSVNLPTQEPSLP